MNRNHAQIWEIYMKYRICTHLLPNHRLKAIASSFDKFAGELRDFFFFFKASHMDSQGSWNLSVLQWAGASRLEDLLVFLIGFSTLDQTFYVLPPQTRHFVFSLYRAPFKIFCFSHRCLLLLSFLPIEMFECSFWPDINWSTSFQIALGFSKFFNCRSLLK